MKELSNSLKANLCKGLRACGIPKSQALQLENVFSKWYRESGPEWTNSRIKDLRQWYETYLTGNPEPPGWFKHTKSNLPVGIWNWVFKQSPAKALGVLSMNTILYEDTLSKTQKEKFFHGLAGNKSQSWRKIFSEGQTGLTLRSSKVLNLPDQMPAIHFPTIFDMNGSIPIHDGRSSVRPGENLGLALKALRSSWDSVPQVTFDFLISQNLEGYMPISVLGNDWQIELDRPHDRCVGRVSVLQQPQLKARTVGNPNRITQVTLEPLKKVYMDVLRKLPTDVTHDQESGIRWVQEKLRKGIQISGSDLTSASDLLDIRLSLRLIDEVFGFPKIQGYEDYREYLFEVSRSPWFFREANCEVSWEQGGVLGTGPNFGLLSLTNNAAALQAWFRCRQEGSLPPNTHWTESFRVVGDDIVMLSPMERHYSEIIEGLGGEINHSKTLKSDRVAEFAGRVITADRSYLKAIKYSEPSDNSFLSYVAQLGDQAKYFLKPRQRQAYNLLKEVPGVIVNGPWMQDSYGVPLGPRYHWYLTEVEPVLRTAKPDLDLTDYQMLLLKADLSLDEAGVNNEIRSLDQPLIDEGYLPSQVTPAFKPGGDPRLVEGKPLLDVISKKLKDITPFDDWFRENYETRSQGPNPGTSFIESSKHNEDLDLDL